MQRNCRVLSRQHRRCKLNSRQLKRLSLMENLEPNTCNLHHQRRCNVARLSRQVSSVNWVHSNSKLSSTEKLELNMFQIFEDSFFGSRHQFTPRMPTLIHWVKVLRPTWHKIGHFGDVSQANLLEKQNLTQLKHAFTNQSKCTTTQSKV